MSFACSTFILSALDCVLRRIDRFKKIILVNCNDNRFKAWKALKNEREMNKTFRAKGNSSKGRESNSCLSSIRRKFRWSECCVRKIRETTCICWLYVQFVDSIMETLRPSDPQNLPAFVQHAPKHKCLQAHIHRSNIFGYHSPAV